MYNLSLWDDQKTSGTPAVRKIEKIMRKVCQLTNIWKKIYPNAKLVGLYCSEGAQEDQPSEVVVKCEIDFMKVR